MTDKKVREEVVYNEWLDRAYNVYLHKRGETTYIQCFQTIKTYTTAIYDYTLKCKIKILKAKVLQPQINFFYVPVHYFDINLDLVDSRSGTYEFLIRDKMACIRIIAPETSGKCAF